MFTKRFDSRNKNWMIGWVGVLCLMVCLVFINLPQAISATRRFFGGTLTVLVERGVQTTDPVKIATFEEMQIAYAIHETLFHLAPDGSFEPVLAQELPVVHESGKEWVIRLRPNAKFHDGTQITVDEVIASWQRLVQRGTDSPHWWLLAPVQGAMEYRYGKATRISGLERVNKLTLRVRLRVSIPNFLECLCALPTAILPSRWLKDTMASGKHIPGAGPFVWQEASSDVQDIRLSAFLGHRKGRPYLNKVVFKRLASKKDLRMELRLRGAQLALTYPNESLDLSDYRVLVGPQTSTVFLVASTKFAQNLPKDFFDDVHRALDLQSLVNYVVGDRGRIMDEHVLLDQQKQIKQHNQTNQRKVSEYFKRLNSMRIDAKQPPWTFIVQKNNRIELQAAERIQLQLNDLGLNVLIVELKRSLFDQRKKMEEYDLVLDYPLPLVRSYALKLLSVIAQAESDQSIEHYLQWFEDVSGDGMDVAVMQQRVRAETIQARRIPLFQYSRRFCLHKSVREYVVDSNGLINIDDLWIAN